MKLKQGNKLKKDKLGWEEWHQRIFRVARNFSSQTEIDQAINIENPLKFLIVRHPFHRLVSAYQNKLSFYHVSKRKPKMYSNNLNLEII